LRTPLLHFDYWMGHRPDWRRVFQTGMAADARLRKLPFLQAAGYPPSQAHFLAAMYGYADEGQQVFMIGKKLQGLLDETDTTHIPMEFLQLPFGTFYIALADSPLQIFDGVDAFHQAAGMYLHKLTEGVILVAMWGNNETNTSAKGDDAIQWMVLDLEEALSYIDEDGTQFVDLDGYIRSMWGDPDRDCSDPGTQWPTDGDKNVETMVQLTRLAFNLVLYVNSESVDKTDVAKPHPARKAVLKKKLAEAKKNKKKKKRTTKIQQEIDAISEARVVWLGKSIEEAPERPEPDEKSSSVTTGRVVSRHRRRGHWRPYWRGSRKAADGSRQKGTHRVNKWIPPQWVGSDLGGVLANRGTVYKFRTEKEDHDTAEK
jgi:hypothetical protein